MTPVPFDYVRATTVAEAVAALAEHGDDAKVLAGGHSLLPLMKLRLADPALLVDVGRVAELRGVCEDGDELVIGAATTHHAVVTDPLVRASCPVLAEATAKVGDPQVRHRGTIGGALAHGDAASDLPAVALALDARLVVEGPGGRRTIAARDFFVDYLQTALAPDEVLVEVRVPRLGGDEGTGWSGRYVKFARVAQAWAIVGVCVLVRREDGHVAEARVALTNMGSTPVRATAVEGALAGVPATADALASAASHAADGTSPPADLSAQPDYRAHLARVLVRRALAQAAGVAEPGTVAGATG